ncbi:SRPBCC family protein [uncultured Jatrophihabitans sp.]|uniref:SRPBCC family protein n=1 Tax=uncultured Jatrophihabitans sp. TaxID=1610747 RepID=UPI0035CC12B0
MADYEASVEVGADPDETFHYLSDVANLPRYFERMTSAEAGDEEEVHVVADLGDRTVEGDAWFHIDNDARSLSWGSEGPNDYHGELNVRRSGMGSTVTVVLSTERASGPEIQDGLEQTLDNIKGIVEPAG